MNAAEGMPPDRPQLDLARELLPGGEPEVVPDGEATGDQMRGQLLNVGTVVVVIGDE